MRFRQENSNKNIKLLAKSFLFFLSEKILEKLRLESTEPSTLCSCALVIGNIPQRTFPDFGQAYRIHARRNDKDGLLLGGEKKKQERGQELPFEYRQVP